MVRILMVDPSILDRKRVRAVLEAAGHQVTEAETPAQALKQIAQHQAGYFHLVITEYAFPDEDGVAFIRQLKADQATALSPVMVLSKHMDKDEMFAAIHAGASNLVAKPFGGDLLLRRVTETLAEANVLRQGEEGSLTWSLASYLVREMRRADRLGSPLSLIVGRATPGDSVLMGHLCNAIHRELRASDILARLGEDRLVLILPDTDAAGVGIVQDRLAKAVAALAVQEEDRPALHVQFLMGTATYPDEGSEHDLLLRLAEERAG